MPLTSKRCAYPFAFTLSVPVSRQEPLLQQLNSLGLSYAHIVEEGYLPNGWKRRVLFELANVLTPSLPSPSQGEE